MTFFTRLTRRVWLKMVAGTIGAFLLSQNAWLSWNTRSVPHAEEILWHHVQRILIHPESAVVIGRKYLQYRSSEADARQLTRLLVPEEQLITLRGETGLAKLRNIIRSRIREDFLEDRVVTLEGWVLSLTEVRLCSLVAVKTDKSFALG